VLVCWFFCIGVLVLLCWCVGFRVILYILSPL
jgi:hypothetical protein